VKSDVCRQRTVYEKEKPADVEEVILHDGIKLYEGLSSNFYVVLKDGTIVTAPAVSMLTCHVVIRRSLFCMAQS